jgi:hypothetical protein
MCHRHETINSNKREIGEFMATGVAVATMKAAQVTAAGAGLKIVELEIPDPGPEQVRIKVQACGVCHSDAIIVEGAGQESPIHEFQGMKWPAWWMRWALE